MYKNILSSKNSKVVRREFDPKKIEDVLELKHFIKTRKWKTVCPFYLKFPYADVPTMCKEMLVEYVCMTTN